MKIDFKIARIRNHEAGVWLVLECFCLGVALLLLYLCYFHFPAFHYWVCRAYAAMGHTEAEHKLGEKFLYGNYVEKNEVKT